MSDCVRNVNEALNAVIVNVKFDVASGDLKLQCVRNCHVFGLFYRADNLENILPALPHNQRNCRPTVSRK